MATTNEPTTARHPSSEAGNRTPTMRAITQDRYGDASVLQSTDVERPQPGPGQVLIQVVAAGIDRGTCHLMSGTPYLVRVAGFGLTKPKNPIPGLDVAGRVVAVGRDVQRFTIGDPVFGIAAGSLAEYTVADEEKLTRKPDEMSFEQAAVSAISGITALQALTDVGRLQPGQRVMVIGASGGVGSFAVQLAAALGADVDGVAGTANLELVRSLGANRVFDHRRQDLSEIGQRYDLVLDIGGRNSVRKLRRVLTPTGTLVIVGGEGGNRLTGGVGRQLRAMLLSPFIGQRLTTFISTEHHSLIDRLTSHVVSGEVTPAIGARYPLHRAVEAIAQLDGGRASGKSVITIEER